MYKLNVCIKCMPVTPGRHFENKSRNLHIHTWMLVKLYQVNSISSNQHILECSTVVPHCPIKVPLSIQVQHRLSIALWDNSWDILFKTESEVKHIGGVVLLGQRIKHF